MKATEAKKLLKNATMKFKMDSTSNIASVGWLTLEDDKEWQITSIRAQSNRLDDTSISFQEKPTNPYRHIENHSSWYALYSRREVRLNGYNPDLKKDLAIFDLIQKTIEKYNFNFVSNCELTRAILALEKLGVRMIEFTIDGRSVLDWNRTYRLNNEEREAVNA